MVAAALIVSIFAAVVAGGQWFSAWHGVRQQRLQNLFQLSLELQSSEQRRSRGLLYEVSQERKGLDDWTEEERKAAEEVGQLFNLAAYFDGAGMLPAASLRVLWGPAIHRTFRAAKPLIDRRRARERLLLWPHFERLANTLDDASTT